jgi:hypothetical protein
MASPEREPAEHRDPFDNLRLDEGFVRAARFIEPSALERGRGTDRRDPGRCQVVPASRRLPAGMHRLVWAPRPGYRRRRATRVVAFLAVMAGVISIVVALRHSSRTSTASSAPGTARSSSTSAAPLAPRTAGGIVVPPALLSSLHVGDCVMWEPTSAIGATAARVVACDQPHRSEVLSLIDLTNREPGAWPGGSVLDGIVGSECAAAFNSRVHVSQGVSGAFEPGGAAWDRGVKTLACTVQLPGLTATTEQLSGAVATPA